jgi:hypothetical protein
MKKLFLFSLLVLLCGNIKAQISGYELGSSLERRYNQQTGYFDLSDPESVNIKVSVWGFVKYPGKYMVPIYTTITDLLSYAGGPSNDAHLDDLRIYRVNEDQTQQLIKINYEDLMFESELNSKYKTVPTLETGDILVVPGSPRLYTREVVSIWVSILSALISLSILILNIVRN